jgi:hypothetical protein
MPTADDVYRVHPTRSEIDDVLGQRLSATLGTLNGDGSIHLTQLIFLFEGGRFLLETASSTRYRRSLSIDRPSRCGCRDRSASGCRPGCWSRRVAWPSLAGGSQPPSRP